MKFCVGFKNEIKFAEKVFGCLDNYVRNGCGKFSVLRRNNLSSVINVVSNSLKISDLTKRKGFQLNLSQNHERIGWKCCGADFSSVWDPLTRSLPKKVLKQDLLGI